jgi:uroporphyrinogen decarboxylase
MSRYDFDHIVSITKQREPDFSNIVSILNCKTSSRPTLFEFYANDRFEKGLLEAAAVASDDEIERKILFFRYAGYDYATLHASHFKFPTKERKKEKSQSFGSAGLIADRKSFEGYPWPEPEDFLPTPLEDAQKFLPNGMKIMVPGPCGVLENCIDLCGYENLCYLLYDDRSLVKAIFNAIGERLFRYYAKAISYDCVGILMDNDDWGFNTQTSLSCQDLREFVFPWHKKYAQLAHERDKQVVLHSCGQLASVYEDIIDDLKIDGKHSFEDGIDPVESVYAKYHDRLAILGGIDLDFMCRKSPEQIYERSLAMLRSSKCNAYALGTGNSIPDYVPDENYCALLLAALENQDRKQWL